MRNAPEFLCHHLRNESLYLRWAGLFEFVVAADGTVIHGQPLRADTYDAFRVYLLNQVISFALILQGREPLHATAVETEAGTVAFIGDSGFGKSTLAATFLAAGHRLVTDDLLTTEIREAVPWGFPGPPQMKLFPQTAEAILGPRAAAGAMIGVTRKLVLNLEPSEWVGEPMPLKAIYVLSSEEPRNGRVIDIHPLRPREAFIQLVTNTFNTVLTGSQRLQRQLKELSVLASIIPIKSLSYPRSLPTLSHVREAIVRDVAS